MRFPFAFILALIAQVAMELGVSASPIQRDAQLHSRQLAARAVTPVSIGHKHLVNYGASYVSEGYPASPDLSIATTAGNTIEDIMVKYNGIHGVYVFNPTGQTITKLTSAAKSQVQSKSRDSVAHFERFF